MIRGMGSIAFFPFFHGFSSGFYLSFFRPTGPEGCYGGLDGQRIFYDRDGGLELSWQTGGEGLESQVIGSACSVLLLFPPFSLHLCGVTVIMSVRFMKRRYDDTLERYVCM